jgi:hypothetical protein
MAIQNDTTTFTLVFKKGLADRNRLPIEQVIKTLQEFQELVREVGKQVQSTKGVESPDGDFGIELLASTTGLVFRKGSLKATAAATKDVENAAETFSLIQNNVRAFAKPSAPNMAASMTATDTLIARRMHVIGGIQQKAKTELAVVVKTPEKRRATTATLTPQAVTNLDALSAPQMRVGAVTLYGKLRELKDRSKEVEGGKYFWGELQTETHEKWRLRFPVKEVNNVLPLFRSQVTVQGNATYFGAQSPRLEVLDITHDPSRNYLDAFAELSAIGAEVFGDADSKELIEELYS